MMGMFIILIVMVSQMHTYVNIKLSDLNMRTLFCVSHTAVELFFFNYIEAPLATY